MTGHLFKRLFPAVILLLTLWFTRIHALDAFPFHVDEGIHTRWAVEVWHGHPFWNISDAKIIAHWPIAAFYPQNAPTFVARVPTALISMVGMAAGYALALRLFGMTAAVLASLMWIASPYLFFYDRLALMDAEIGALGVLALWGGVVLTQKGTYRNAVIAGVALALAILFKLTAVVFIPLVGLLPLLNARYPLRRLMQLSAVAALACAACFVVPLAYMLLRAQNFFDVPRQFVSTGGGASGSLAAQFIANLEKFWLQLVGFEQPVWVIALIGGLFLLLVFGGRWGRTLLLGAGLSLAVILVLGKQVYARYYVAVLPTLLVLAGLGLGVGIKRLSGMLKMPVEGRLPAVIVGIVGLLLFMGVLPYMLTAYNNPAGLTLSEAMREQNYFGPSAGFGLREAVWALPTSITRPELPVVASMRPDSCYQANLYAGNDLRLTCADAPGIERINAALDEQGAVYVLTDHMGLIGVDVNTLDATPTEIARYPRPGETAETATIVLWLLEK